MPLKTGYSHETFEKNYSQLKKEGHSHAQALAIAFDYARKSFFTKYPNGALPTWLVPKGGERLKNPVPPSSRAHKQRHVEDQKEQAKLLYEKFTGHNPGDEVMIDKPVYPDVMSVIGDIDGILYTTVRDGKTESYIHKFKKNSRPLFCVAPDGKSLYMLGGAYQFGERGIVDN